MEKVRYIGRVFKIIGYGERVGDIHGWYYYDDFMKFFNLYLEPFQELLAFPNTEVFINTPEIGNWDRYQDPRLPERTPRNRNESEEPEADQNPQQASQPGRGRPYGRGREPPRRGGGGSGRGRGSGYGRGFNNNNNNYGY